MEILKMNICTFCEIFAFLITLQNLKYKKNKNHFTYLQFHIKSININASKIFSFFGLLAKKCKKKCLTACKNSHMNIIFFKIH